MSPNGCTTHGLPRFESNVFVWDLGTRELPSEDGQCYGSRILTQVILTVVER